MRLRRRAGSSAIRYLRTGDRRWDLRSYVAIHLSLVLAVGVLITGSIWANASWGHWWVWDEPTLVSFLIVFLLYASYQPLRFSIEDPERQARYASVFAIVAGAFVPMNFVAVRLAEQFTHPRVLGTTGGSLPGSMRLTFLVALLGDGAAVRHALEVRDGVQERELAAPRAAAAADRRGRGSGPRRTQRRAAPRPAGGGGRLMPALPLDEAGKYVAGAYVVFFALILIYVAIMAVKLQRFERDVAELHAELDARDRARESPSSDAEAADAERPRRPRSGRSVSEVLALGVSHKTAPVELRERLALPAGPAEAFLGDLVAGSDVHEAVAISTCNRTEVYLVAADPVAAETAVLGMLARRGGIRPTELARSIYALRNCDAARHLYRVTAGLESMIVGEAEVQGQVKRAYEGALEAGSTGPLTNRLFHAALATGKRVRTETAIGERHLSVSSVAVALARDVLGDLAERHVVDPRRRRDERARRPGARRPGRDDDLRREPPPRPRAWRSRPASAARPCSSTHLPEELARADIVVASTSSPHPIVTAEELALVMRRRAGRPLLLVDLAVPRDVEAGCRELPGVTLHDIDDLQAVVRRNRSVREAEAEHAEEIVEEEIQVFARWLGSLDVLPTVSALRAHGRSIADGVVEENAGRWESASPRDLERAAAIARAVATRLLHEPTLHLKRREDGRAHGRIELLRELFGLDDDPAEAEAEGEPAEVHPLPRRAESRGR